ncbi:MAG TPA: hypothetical protein VJB59_15780 [Bdellovibrionota bacterium]|nr:hypothetical protein [Bdellovibrionota bacterium]
MKKEKFGKGTLTIAMLVTASFLYTQARAVMPAGTVSSTGSAAKGAGLAARATIPSSDAQAPYQSCEGISIKYVDRDSEAPKICDTCKQQLAPEIAWLEGALDKTSYGPQVFDFTTLVAEKMRDNMKKGIKDYSELKVCFDNPARAGCEDKVASFKKDLKKAFEDRRESQMLYTAIGHPTGYKFKEYPVPMITSKGFEGEEVSKDVIDGLNATIADTVTMQKHQCVVKKLQGEKCHRAIDKALGEFAEFHKARSAEITLAKMPIVPFLLTPKVTGKRDPMANKEISKALGDLIDKIQDQVDLTNKSLKEGKLNFEKKGKTESTTLLQNRDLLDHLAFTPVVEEVLKEHPGYCGLASSLAKRLDIRTTKRGVAAGATIVALFVSTAGVSAVLGTAAEAGAMMNLAGLGVGFGFVGQSYLTYDSTKEAVAAGVQDYKMVEKKFNELSLNLLLHPLDYLGAGAGAKALMKRLSSFASMAQGVKKNPQALKVAQQLAKDLVKGVTDKKTAAKLADPTEFRKALMAAARENGFSEKEAKQIASCGMGDRRVCAGMEKLLAKATSKEGTPMGGGATLRAASRAELNAATDSSTVKAGAATLDNAAPKAGAATSDAPITFDYDVLGKNVDNKLKMAIETDWPTEHKAIREALENEDEAFKAIGKQADGANRQKDIVTDLMEQMGVTRAKSPKEVQSLRAKIIQALRSCGYKI